METTQTANQGKMKVIQIGDTYSAEGIKREVISRHGDIVLGARQPNQKIGRNDYYDAEILEVQTMKSDHEWPNGSVTLAGSESLPPSSAFGRKAFSIFKFSLAKSIFTAMTKDESDRNFCQKFEHARLHGLWT